MSTVEHTYDIHIEESIIKCSSIWKKKLVPRTSAILRNNRKTVKKRVFVSKLLRNRHEKFFYRFFTISNKFANFSQKKFFPLWTFGFPTIRLLLMPKTQPELKNAISSQHIRAQLPYYHQWTVWSRAISYSKIRVVRPGARIWGPKNDQKSILLLRNTSKKNFLMFFINTSKLPNFPQKKFFLIWHHVKVRKSQ